MNRGLKAFLVLIALFAGTSQASLRGSPEEAQIETRIINGENAEQYRYPYFVMLLHSGLCGGVLIGPDLILSAAHCQGVSGTARIGVYDRRRMQDTERIVIEEEVVHPSYSDNSFRYDIMLIKLRQKSTHEYAKINDNDDTPDHSNEMTVIGFGDTAIGNGVRIPFVLQETELDYVDNEECRGMHGNFIIQDDMLCAYREDTDSCFGDSGGPLVIKGRDPEDDVVVGTVSWGRDCATRGFAGVYARVSYFYDWIVQTSCLLSPDDAPFDCSQVSFQHSTQTFPSSEPSAAPSMEPSTLSLETSFVAWSPGRPLKQCEGDCDDDTQCEGDLVCFERNGMTVPGCTGKRKSSITDYCIRPEDYPR